MATEFSFADAYRQAGLNPGPEIIALREAPFEKLRNELTPQRSGDLSRLYFGLNGDDSSSWLRDAFCEGDKSFSLINNAREVAVLASCLLRAGQSDGEVSAMLAPLVASACGNRKEVVSLGLLEHAVTAAQQMSVRDRGWPAFEADAITLPTKGNVTPLADALSQDWTKATALFKQVSDEAHADARRLATQVTKANTKLVQSVSLLQEEVGMLWWLISSWSRRLDTPLSEMKAELIPVLVGLDMADLTRFPPGPISAPALLQRALSDRKHKHGKLTLPAVVWAMPVETIERLRLSKAISSVRDICPVLGALQIAIQLKDESAWSAQFAAATQLDAGASFRPLELAVQVYREAMFVGLLG